MKRNNIPLNFKEKNNSKISLYCSVAVLLLLFFCFHQLDYSLITKPETEAKEAAAQKQQEAEAAAETPEISTASVIAVGDIFTTASCMNPENTIPAHGITTIFTPMC